MAATIQGIPAQVTTADNVNYTATAVMPGDVKAGAVKFTLNYKTAAGADAEILAAAELLAKALSSRER